MSAHPSSPGPSSQSISTTRQQKQKPITIGIAAGAEDAKYQAKYKDLKRKVKDIEADNDKLHFKVLQAKRSIQRMKLERAILYERLTGTPTPIDTQIRHPGPQPIHPSPAIPPHPPYSRSHSGSHHYQDLVDNHPPIESDRSTTDYGTPRERHRVAPASDARNTGALPPMGPGVGPTSHITETRRHSAGYEPSRHIVHMQSIPGPGPIHHPRPSPTMHHAHSHSHSHEPTRPHSRTRTQQQQQQQQQPYMPNHPHQYPEGLPSVQQQVMHSPPLLERERSRRHDNHEGFSTHGDPHQHNRLASFMPRLSPTPHGSRPSSRVRSHQRMSPGPYMSREEPYDRQRATDHEREWEREREREWGRERERERGRGRDRSRDHGRHRDMGPIVSPQITHRQRQPTDRGDYPEPMSSSRAREEFAYYRDAALPPPAAPSSGYPVHSRSESPVSVSVSASGSGNGAGDGPSRPESRHYYDHHDRTRSYRLRPVNQPNEDNMDFVHEDGRSMPSRDRGVGGGGGTSFPPPPPEQGRSSLDTRKRGRNDMDVDSDDAGEGPVYTGGRTAEDRGKRYHREHRRSVDNQEEGRMGPP